MPRSFGLAWGSPLLRCCKDVVPPQSFKLLEVRPTQTGHARTKRQTVSKSTKNAGTRWTSAQMRQLAQEAAGNTPTRVIGIHLGRTEAAIYAKASEEGISLSPTNQSPYGAKDR